MFPPRISLLLLGLAGLAASPRPAWAQASGNFVVPAFRPDAGTRFSYWDRFTLPPGRSSSYQFDHYPNVLDLGDDDGNPSNWNTNAKLQQVLTGNCFVTSSGALYSFSDATGFEISYTHTGSAPVAGVVCQLRYAGTDPLPASVRLRYQPAGGGAPVLLAPAFKALDNPGTAGFAEKIVRGYEWNLTGLGVTDYRIQFQSETSSMALYEVQLDNTTGSTFQQALGHLLSTSAAPAWSFGTGGTVGIQAEEKRFFLAGQEVPLTALATTGFNAVGWIQPDGTIVDSPENLTITFSAQNPQDLAAAAIFSPADWATFRFHAFNHANSLTGTANDYLNDAISGPAADPDKDGRSNFTEYAFGGNPLLADAPRMAAQPVILTESGLRYPGLIYRRRAGENDLSYQVQTSTSLTTWQTGTEAVPLVTESAGPLEPDGTRTITARALTPVSATPLFLRVTALPITP
jgi:hypothetical protein